MAETLFDFPLEGPPLPSLEPVPAPFSAPATAEVLLSLGRSLNPRWRQCYGPSAPAVAPDREHAALRLGLMASELMLAAHARDNSQAGQRLSDAAAVEKLLGISETTRPRHLLLHDLAESGQWDTFRRGVEALTEEQQLALEGQRDPDLARLLPVAAWLRVLEVEASLLASTSAPTVEPVGLHPQVVEWLRHELSQLEDRVRENRSVARCEQVCERLERLLQQPSTAAGRREKLAETLQTALTRLHTP
jgi:hypothetical protein